MEIDSGLQDTKTKTVVIGGTVLELPLRWNQRAQMYIEQYPDLLTRPVYTRSGERIMLTIEDACPQADLEEGGVDCGACRHFRPVPGTLLGVCRNEKRPAPGAQPNPKPEEERP